MADRDGHKLLLSKYVLDYSNYNDELTNDFDWNGSSVRKWLNVDFYNMAFSDEDKKNIVLEHNENPDIYEPYSSWSINTVVTEGRRWTRYERQDFSYDLDRGEGLI